MTSSVFDQRLTFGRSRRELQGFAGICLPDETRRVVAESPSVFPSRGRGPVDPRSFAAVRGETRRDESDEQEWLATKLAELVADTRALSSGLIGEIERRLEVTSTVEVMTLDEQVSRSMRGTSAPNLPERLITGSSWSPRS